MAVATSSGTKQFERKAASHRRLFGFFRHVVKGADVGRGKPAPDIYLRAAQLFEGPVAAAAVAPRDCLAFEDAPSGVASATAAGMQVCVREHSNRFRVGQTFLKIPRLSDKRERGSTNLAKNVFPLGCDDPRRADAGGPAEGGHHRRAGHRALLPPRALRSPALRLLDREGGISVGIILASVLYRKIVLYSNFDSVSYLKSNQNSSDFSS